MNTKKEAREALKVVKKEWMSNMTSEEKKEEYERFSTWIIQSTAYKKSDKIGFYASQGDEFPLDLVLENAFMNKKKVYFPFVRGEELVWKRVKDLKWDMEKGYQGILEPRMHLRDLDTHLDLVLVPGMGFTPLGVRLGRGKGFYDRFLSTSNQTWKMGVCWNCQIVQNLPMDHFDVEMDEVVTIGYGEKADILNQKLKNEKEKEG